MTTNIEAQFHPTHDEQARQRFVSMLRKHAIVDMRRDLRDRYEQSVQPGLSARNKTPRNWRDIRAAMLNDHLYRFYSTTRLNAQEMCYQSVQPTIERELPAMQEIALRAREQSSAGGSLRLDPTLQIPPYVTQLDVHMAPGYTHLEHGPDDVAQGAVIAFGGKVFTGQHPYRKNRGTVGESVSYWLSKKFPNLKPQRVLDLGTCSGKNLLPFADTFPQAQLHGVDVGAPVLRFGHACASHENVPVHFSQQNAESMDFADGSFDIITSSFFFHEVPVTVTRRILSECFRLLSAGGVMVHMELPNETAVGDYENFFWNWDTQNNNEPNYTQFRSQDLAKLCKEAGFAPDRCFAHLIPDLASNGSVNADQCISGDRETPAHGLGGWFVFGSQKPI